MLSFVAHRSRCPPAMLAEEAIDKAYSGGQVSCLNANFLFG
jgi:hypothetical protein